MKKIVAFLLSFAIAFSIVSPSVMHAAADEIAGTEISGSTVSTDSTDNSATDSASSKTFVDGISVEVSGKGLPKDAEVVADIPSYEKTDILSKTISGEEVSENETLALDISLESDGNLTQPENESVRVSLGGFSLEENDEITIYHVMDDATAIVNRLNSGENYELYVIDEEDKAHFEKETEAFLKAVSLLETENFSESENYIGTNTICVEKISSEKNLKIDSENGIMSFDTDSFSTYYIVKGNSTSERVYSTTSIIKFGSMSSNKTDTFYVTPDSKLTFFSANTDWDSKVAATWNFNARGSSMTYKVASNQKSATVTIPESAKISSNATLTVKYNNKTYTANLIVASNEENIEKARTTCRVMLTVVPKSAQIPSEPSLATGFNWKIINGSYVVEPTSDQGTKFAENGQNIIKPEIKNVLTQSIDGTHTWGYANTDGDIKNYLKNIDWDKALNALIKKGGFYGTDGKLITSNNKNDYELIPYVIKLQSLSGTSWNIDCYIKRKAQVTLSYDANLGEGVTLRKSFGLPNSTTVNINDNTTVGKISYDGSNISKESTIDVIGPDGISYVYKFLGWGTSRTAVNTSYDPGKSVKLDKNVRLYAIWGKEVKVCYNANGGVVTADKYTLRSDKFINQDGSMYYQSWPYDDAKKNGLVNDTTFGLKRAGYIFNQWNTKPDGSGVTIHQDDNTIKSSTLEKYLTDKNKSRCLKLYAQWIYGLGQIKITNSGCTPEDKDQVFIFAVKGVSDAGEKIDLRVQICGNGSAVITDVPFGTYDVYCETDWSWRYDSTGDQKVKVDTLNKTYNADFNQTRTDSRWLQGCAYRKNEFEEENV